MFWSFLLSFFVLTANSLWVFGDNFGENYYDSISVVAKLIYIVTIVAQCSSLMYAILSLKMQFDTNPALTAYLSDITDHIRRSCGFCCFLVLFPIVYASYLIFIILISLCLGITKLLTIRQVREFWLSFLIADYDPVQSVHNFPKCRVSQQSERNSVMATNNRPIEIEVMRMSNQMSLGELKNNTMSPNNDFLDHDEPENEVRRRVSNSAIQSVQMKVFKCCDCCTPSWMSSLYINEAVYNNYLMSELIIESIPLLMLNLVNMFLMDDRITTVSLIQAGCAVVFLFYSVAKTMYFVRYNEWNLAKFLS